MTLDLQLDVIALGVAVLALVVAALAWRTARASRELSAPGPDLGTLNLELQRLERSTASQIRTVLDLLQTQAASLRQLGDRPVGSVAHEVSSTMPTVATPEQVVASVPPIPAPVPDLMGNATAEELGQSSLPVAFDAPPPDVSGRLDRALQGQSFREGLWPKLIHDFNASERLVAEFLRAKDVGEIEIQARPPLPNGDANHWKFLVIRPLLRNGTHHAFVVPRYLERYDPLFHRQLFDVQGTVERADTFFAKLLRCPVLDTADPTEGTFGGTSVVRRGLVAVTATPAG